MSNVGKRVNNLLTKLRVDENSILSAKGEILEDKTVKKLSKSKYSKDIVLYNLYKEYIKNGRKKEDFKTKKIFINTPFVQERYSTQRGDMLHTIDGPMQLVHADVADLNFFSIMRRHVYLKNLHLQHEKNEPAGRQIRKVFIENPGAQEKLNQRRQRGNTSSNRSRI